MVDWSCLFQHSLELNGPAEEAALGQIPARRGVALLRAAAGQPILLLPAADLRTRIANRLSRPTEQERRKMPDLHAVTREILWALTTSHFETDLLYFELARQIWPEDYREMVAFKPPWFVSVDPAAELPSLRRGHDIAPGGGLCVGPFPSARLADRFIGIVEDVFLLCREPRHLAEAPHGSRCTYGQMGRCLSPCDGSIAMPAYRQIVAEAARFAAGDRQHRLAALAAEMKAAAASLQFEQAARCKALLERAAELDEPDFAHIRPVEQLCWLSVQQSGSTRRVKLFLVRGPRIAQAEPLDYPPDPALLERALGELDAMGAADWQASPADAWRLGLVTQMLHSSAQRGGVWIERGPGTTAAAVAEQIEAARDVLRVRLPQRRKAKSAPDDTDAGVSADEDRDKPSDPGRAQQK